MGTCDSLFFSERFERNRRFSTHRATLYKKAQRPRLRDRWGAPFEAEERVARPVWPESAYTR
jgi:hypothetical protein